MVFASTNFIIGELTIHLSQLLHKYQTFVTFFQKLKLFLRMGKNMKKHMKKK